MATDILPTSTCQIQPLRLAFERAIARWDRRNRNPHAGALALLRLDEAMAEIEQGGDVLAVLRDCFNDRLLTALEKAYAEVVR